MKRDSTRGKGGTPEMIVPETLKLRISSEGDKFAESVLKARHVEPPPEKPQFNYLVDIHTKWRGRNFYFISRYNSPRPNATSPSFDAPFARMEYIGGDLFGLSYMRHTGQWVKVFSGLSWKECFDMIESIPTFQP